MMRFFRKIVELNGIDEIAEYAEMEIFETMDKINFYNFPARRENSIWVARRGPVRRWLKEYNQRLEKQKH